MAAMIAWSNHGCAMSQLQKMRVPPSGEKHSSE